MEMKIKSSADHMTKNAPTCKSAEVVPANLEVKMQATTNAIMTKNSEINQA